jgi:hypothetical protein
METSGLILSLNLEDDGVKVEMKDEDGALLRERGACFIFFCF